MVVGTPDAWDECIHLNGKFHYRAYTWSPCGRFIAVQARDTVEILDPLSSELLSTLIHPDGDLTGHLAYSPDGRSVASLSGTSLITWDVQTGGVARKIEGIDANNVSLAWSLEGGVIAAISQGQDADTVLLQDQVTNASYSVHVYDVASGTTLSSGTLQSRGKPRLWAHGTSFRVIAVEEGDQVFTIETFEAGSVFTKGESSCIESWGQHDRIGSFCPSTYRLSVSNPIRNQVRILDIRKSECLLEEFGEGKKFGPNSHCFSPDGILFAAASSSGVHIWKHASGRYTLWRQFPVWTKSTFSPFHPQFSPTSSSILGRRNGPLQVWRLDGPPISAHLDDRTPFAVLSYCGTYIAAGRVGGNTITITNLNSRTPPQFIDTGIAIGTLALTGNILLAWGSGELVAWRLTEKGVVDGAPTDRRAGRGDSIWIVSISSPGFLVGDQTVVIEEGDVVVRVYHTGTGEVLEPAKTSSHLRGHQYSLWEMQHCQHYPNYRNLGEQRIPSEDEWPVTQATVEEGWVKDLEGKHRLWIPVEWRVDLPKAGWLRNTTLLLNPRDAAVVVTI